MTISLPLWPQETRCVASLAAGSFWTLNQPSATADSLVEGAGGASTEAVYNKSVGGRCSNARQISHTAAPTTTVAHTHTASVGE